MAWPADGLTKVHLDQASDDPSQARAELVALIDKVKLMLAEVTVGKTIATYDQTPTKIFKLARGADVSPSSGVLTVGNDGNYFHVTGTNTLESISTKGIGTTLKLHFVDGLMIKNGAAMELPGGRNIDASAGDEAEFVEFATGDWRLTNYQKNFLPTPRSSRANFVPLLATALGLEYYSGRASVVAVGDEPRYMAFDGTHVWVANWLSDNVSKIDITTTQVVATVAVGTDPRGITFDGTHIWVTSWLSNNVSKIDIVTNTVVATVAVGSLPTGAAFDGTHIWVANYSDDNVSKIDIVTNTVVATVAVGSNPIDAAFDGTHIWVANYYSDTVSKIYISTDTVITTISVGTGPESVAYDGTHLWVANTTSNNVSKIDISTDTVVATVSGVNSGIKSVAFDGTHIWVTNSGTDTITKIDIHTNTIVATLAVAGIPRGAVFDGTHVWVAQALTDTVTRIVAK